MDLAALKTELQTDPAALGYAAAIEHDAALVCLLNARRAELAAVVPLLPITSVLKWAAPGPLQQLTDYAADTSKPATWRSVCMAALKLFGMTSPLDLSDPDINGNAGMVQGLAAAGVLTESQVAALLALQNRAPASRAEVLFGADVVVSERQVHVALRVDPAEWSGYAW